MYPQKYTLWFRNREIHNVNTFSIDGVQTRMWRGNNRIVGSCIIGSAVEVSDVWFPQLLPGCRI
jgi:hypothetical protein